MKNVRSYRLTKEERDIVKWITSGKAKSLPNLAQHKKHLAASARTQREKTTMVSIRVREHDLERLRARAEREGLPYQTAINALIHKYAQEEYDRKSD
ncbi:antitoxin [Candidatus Kaiserbacteria bacterium]|nr:antitoxin [Candidatus Kaiserbacteria bacterium]